MVTTIENRLYKVLKIIDESDEPLEIYDISNIIKIERGNLQLSLKRYTEEGFIEPVILKEPGLLKGHFEEHLVYDITDVGGQMIDKFEKSDVETRTYHKHNYLKFKVLQALYDIYPKSVTCNELAEIIGIEKGTIRNRLSVYHHYGYIGRRKGREPGINRLVYKYRLNILGINTYMNLLALYKQGRELNLRKWQRGKSLQKMDSYIGESRAVACEGNT
ncbi:hypothetical protein [Methanococcoides sp. FTZ1]|uniref:hypothetical protein n=1 Tax=Methanococcoides sp. FTZ1 TaxID=3439061 RepID=UPI003F85384D